MPVTARLLQRLNEALGDEATNDLLAWWEESVVTRAELRESIDRVGDRFAAELNIAKAELRTEIAATRSDMIKWMFIFWAGTTIPLAGLLMVVLFRQ